MHIGSSTMHSNIFIQINFKKFQGMLGNKKIHYSYYLFLSEVISNLNAFWKFHCAFKYFY